MASFEYVKVGDGTTAWSNLPYVAGYPGLTGSTGVTGPTGPAGVSGGLILQLDYSPTTTYSGTTLNGTLLTSFNAGTQTDIIVPSLITNANVVNYTIPVSLLPGITAVGALWDLNLYATPSVPSSPPTYYFNVYDGSSLVASGTGAIVAINSSTPMQQYTSSLYVPAHSYTTDLTIKVFVTTPSGSTLTIGMRDSTISHIHTSLVTVGSVGSTGPTGASGVTGPTGASGPVGTWAVNTLGIPLDAGGPTTNFRVSHYPAFDCGGVTGPVDTSFMATMLYTSFMDSWLTE